MPPINRSKRCPIGNQPSYPLTQITGSSRATVRARPAWSAASMAAHTAPGAVTGGAEGEIHALVRTGENIGSGSHRAADQNRLADRSQGLRHRFVPRAKGARGAFAMDEEAHFFPRHGMLFDFASVVRYVVKQRQFRPGKYFLERLSHQVSDDLSIGQRTVDRPTHGAQIGFSH